MSESMIMEGADLDRLYEAAENIRDTFAPLAGTSPSDEEIDRAEISIRRDMRTIYLHLFAMAIAELEMKSRSSGWFFLSTVSYEFDEIAHITAETPYSTRGEDNLLEITNLSLRFFSGSGNTGKMDLFFFLKGITGVNLSRILKKISRSEKKLLHYIFSAVTRHVASSPRYRRCGDIVTDLEAPCSSPRQQAAADEIIASCAPLLQGSEKPGRIIDLIFDDLLQRGRYSDNIHISTLRTAAYELTRSRFIQPHSEITRNDPMQEYLQKEMFLLAREALHETSGAYGWRKGGSAECREAYEKAGWDMLEEIIVHGRKIQHHEALSRHIKGCSVEVYRKKHMGSFQNFWKVLWEIFLKKIRADI